MATACERKEKHASFYRARDPHASPMHRLFSKHFDEFERVYPERYQQPDVVRKIVDHCGLARDPPTPGAEPTRDDLKAAFEDVKVVPLDEFLATL